jgi:predicted proteasome-type protease
MSGQFRERLLIVGREIAADLVEHLERAEQIAFASAERDADERPRLKLQLLIDAAIDLALIRRDAFHAELNYRIEPGEPYFTDLRERWSEALREAHIAIPRPPYVNGTSTKFSAK